MYFVDENKAYTYIFLLLAKCTKTFSLRFLLETLGAERGKTKIKKYFKNIHEYIIMFDVTQAVSYDHIINWKSNVDAENESGKPLPCILLANKVRSFLRVLLFSKFFFFLVRSRKG
jgi:GTPase SAR1 family protein